MTELKIDFEVLDKKVTVIYSPGLMREIVNSLSWVMPKEEVLAEFACLLSQEAVNQALSMSSDYRQVMDYGFAAMNKIEALEKEIAELKENEK